MTEKQKELNAAAVKLINEITELNSEALQKSVAFLKSPDFDENRALVTSNFVSMLDKKREYKDSIYDSVEFIFKLEKQLGLR